MALIEWNPNHSVGIEEMDAQHRKLALLCNQYDDVMKTGKGDSPASSILQQILAYTQAHFFAEEQLMAQWNYPNRVLHKQFHAELLTQIGRMVEKVKTGNEITHADISAFLKDWLVNHIVGTDKLYGQFITAGAVH